MRSSLGKARLVVNILIALVVAPLVRRRRARPLLLVGGHEGELFTDNGRAMYQYLREHQPGYDVFWVTNAGSAAWGEVDRPLRRGSVRAFVYYLIAEGGFFSHTASDLAPVLYRYVRPHNLVRVHLQHGVLGLKASKVRGSHHHGLAPDADLWVCLSDFERSVMVEQWKLPPDRVRVTGYPRYDVFPRSSSSAPEITFMPTWREWLLGVDEDTFVASEFFVALEALLTSPELHQVLEEHEVDLVVHLHFYFHRYAGLLPPARGRVRYAPVTADVRDALQRGCVLVTDYSSVAFDFCFHLGKPVIFHQPDLATYLTERGSYLKLPDELFGPQSTTPTELVGHLSRVLKDPAEAASQYASKRSTYFPFEDTGNGARVFAAYQDVRGSLQGRGEGGR